MAHAEGHISFAVAQAELAREPMAGSLYGCSAQAWRTDALRRGVCWPRGAVCTAGERPSAHIGGAVYSKRRTRQSRAHGRRNNRRNNQEGVTQKYLFLRTVYHGAVAWPVQSETCS